MSDVKKEEGPSEEESSSSDEDSSSEEDPDDHYDPTTENYNPLLALYYPDRALPFLPWPKAPTLDNLAQYTSAIRGKVSGGPGKVSAKVLKIEPEGPSTSTQRRFLPHQEPVKGRGRKPQRNVITRMEVIQGPLAVLKDAMERRVRVKVVIRGMEGWAGKETPKSKGPANVLATRGELHGAICAFDRHWNMALEDVLEVFRRRAPKHQKTIPDAGAEFVDWPVGYKKPPRVRVIRKEHRYEVCERYLGQVMVRGEQVALVSIT